MDEAIKRANRVVRGMLDFSAPSTLERQSVRLNDVIEQALALVKHQLNHGHIDVRRALAEDLPELSLDGNKIEQVFVNLFLNASEAIQETGTVGVTTAVRKLSQSAGRPGEVCGRDDEVVVVAEVEDTGSGIPEEHLSRVFEPFFTTKPESVRGPGSA